MDKALIHLLLLPEGMRQQPLRELGYVVLSFFQLTLAAGLCRSPGDSDQLDAQIRSISIAIGGHICRPMAVLACDDWYSQGKRFQDRCGNAVACRRSHIYRTSRQQRQEFVMSEVAEQQKARALAQRP